MIDGVGSPLFGMPSALVQAQVIAAVAGSVADAFYLNLAGAALGFVVAGFMSRERLDFAPLR